MNNKIRAIGAALIVVIWLTLTGLAWFSPAKDFSTSERANLQQFPELTVDTLLAKGDKNFMSIFNEFTLDQFPLRDQFRQLKALFHLNVMNYSDNNGLYIHDGYIADMTAVTDYKRVEQNMASLNRIYELYLKEANCNVAVAVVPDKNYYMAGQTGHLSLDYDAIFGAVKETTDGWATYVDLTDLLELSDFYYTDTHWRQEKILPVAQAISNVFGVEGPKAEDFTQEKLDNPFYGVYYGQIAMPVPGEDLVYLNNAILEGCTVTVENGTPYSGVYDMTKENHYDLYELFLSGPVATIVIENPNARTDKELIVIRDSFGSSLVPLMVQDYAKVTVLDSRWLTAGTRDFGKYVTFQDQDVLLVYSALVLNNMNLK